MPEWVGFFLDGICHRYPGNALTYGGELSPLCARCTGMFCGSLAVLLLLAVGGSWRRGGYPRWSTQGLAVALAVWWAIDGLNSLAYGWVGRPLLYEPTAGLRVFTGAGLGMVLALLLWPVAVQVVVEKHDSDPAVSTAWQGVGLVLVTGLVGTVLLSARVPWALVAIWTLSGAAILLSGANALLVALVTRMTGSRLTPVHAISIVAAGILLAALETGVLSMLRRLIGA